MYIPLAVLVGLLPLVLPVLHVGSYTLTVLAIGFMLSSNFDWLRHCTPVEHDLSQNAADVKQTEHLARALLVHARVIPSLASCL